MRTNVAQLLKSPIGSVRGHAVDEDISLDDSGGEKHVHGEVKFTRTDRSILVKALLETDVEVTCSRCLKTFDYKLKLDFEEEFFPSIDVVSGVRVAAPDEPGCFMIDARHILDLSGAVQQYALFGLPMKPLCNTDCAGLCPTCGRDLNDGPCNCPVPEDARWTEVRKLLSRAK